MSGKSGNGTEHDSVQEAINRASYERSSAYGEVDGEDVLIVAEMDGNPTLSVYAGGNYEAYAEPDVDDEYVGGERITRTFSRVDRLTTAFNALREKYDLQEVHT